MGLWWPDLEAGELDQAGSGVVSAGRGDLAPPLGAQVGLAVVPGPAVLLQCNFPAAACMQPVALRLQCSTGAGRHVPPRWCTLRNCPYSKLPPLKHEDAGIWTLQQQAGPLQCLLVSAIVCRK